MPAYRELLLLYAIARDLADKPDVQSDAPITSVIPLTATRPFIADPDVRPTLDVDLCLDELAPEPPAASASASVFASKGLPGSEAGAEAKPPEPGSDYRP